MQTLMSRLHHITKLRQKHTALVKAGKWAQAETVRHKIVTAWDGFDRVLDQKRRQERSRTLLLGV